MMKSRNLKFSLLALALIGFMLSSCNNDEVVQDGIVTEAIDQKALETEAVIDQVSDESSAIIEEAFLMQEYPESKVHVTDRYLPDCVVITVVIVQNMKTVTIDFGDGCQLRNGNLVSGKVILTYTKDPEAATKQISFEYDGFTFNNKGVAGGGSILRERANENGNPQSTKTFDITVTWPDGASANKNGLKVREKIEGQGTDAWGDDVFLITGNWMFTRRNGTVLSAEVIDALRRELACKFLVSGVLELNKNENNAILNYGDGSCDDLATISINGGEEREIHLSNF